MKKDLFKEFIDKNTLQQVPNHNYWADYSHRIKIAPIYENPGKKYLNSLTVFPEKPWKIGYTIDTEDINFALERAKKCISLGVNLLTFKLNTEKDLEYIKHKKFLNKTNVCYVFKKNNITNQKNNKKNLLCYDVLNHLMKTGNWIKSKKKDLDFWKNNITNNNQTIFIDARTYQNSGANIIDELSFTLNHLNEYLNLLQSDLTKKKHYKVIINISIGNNYFFEIAKLQVLRILFFTISKKYKLNLSPVIISEPSKRYMTIFDYNNNMIRTISACMSSILGGSDIINNIPYDQTFNQPNDFSDRIAINQLQLLKNESHFDKIQNSIQGSYYIENLIQKFTSASLNKFKKIEKKGGLIKCLKNNFIQNLIFNNANKEKYLFHENKKILVGINKYKDDSQKNPISYKKTQIKSIKTFIDPIVESRLSNSLEKIRIKNDEKKY